MLRAASEATAGGMNAVASVSSEAGSALWRSLALRSSSCVRRSRVRGVGLVGRDRDDHHRDPVAPGRRARRACARTSGSAPPAGPRAARRARSASRAPRPAQSVTTTSLTVIPNSRRTWRTASSESEPNAKRRCARHRPVERRLRRPRLGHLEDVGALVGAERAAHARVDVRERRHAGQRVRARQVGEAGDGRRQRAQRPQRLARHARAGRGRASRGRAGSAAGGPLPGGGGSITRPSGSGSSSTAMISLPLMPSTTEWWILVSSATRALGQPVDDVELPQRPRRGPAGARTGAETVSASWRSSPGGGIAVSRTWNSRSKSGSSTQYGQVQPQRHLDEPPAQRRQQVQALLEQLLDLRRRRACRPARSTGRRSPGRPRGRRSGPIRR